MKVNEAVEALKHGHRVKAMPSDAPLNQFDAQTSGVNVYQLYKNDELLILRQVSSCAAEVRRTTTLKMFVALNKHEYLNFAIAE